MTNSVWFGILSNTYIMPRYLIIDTSESFIVEEFTALDYQDFVNQVSNQKVIFGDYENCKAYIECGGDFQEDLKNKLPKPVSLN